MFKQPLSFLVLLLVYLHILDLIYFHRKMYYGIYPSLHQTFIILQDLAQEDLLLLQALLRLEQELKDH